MGIHRSRRSILFSTILHIGVYAAGRPHIKTSGHASSACSGGFLLCSAGRKTPQSAGAGPSARFGRRPSRASGAEVSLLSAISGNRVYARAAETSSIIAKYDKGVYFAAAGVYPSSIFLHIRVYAMNAGASPFFRIWLARVYGAREKVSPFSVISRGGV